jgi:cytochrome c oxidase subunit 2
MNDGGTVWLPESASTLAPTIDSLFYFVYWASVIIFAGVVIAMLYLVWKYRRESHADRMKLVEESRLIEATWIVLPTILVLVVFVWGFRAYIKVGVAPPDAYEIRVTGKQWLWEFEYPDGTSTTGELHVPVDRPVKLVMSSTDVLHSFFVPAFRVKHDVLPNRYTSVWFEATKEGTYKALCTEYCGASHSQMTANVTVQDQGEFESWLKSAGIPSDAPPVERGKILYEQQGCNTCHSLDGSEGTGPTWKGLYGHDAQLADGSTVTADANYIRQSILKPGSQIVKGYQNIMPASYGSLSESELTGLVAFIKKQSEKGRAELKAAGATSDSTAAAAADSISTGDEQQQAPSGPPGAMPSAEASNQ